MQFSTKVEIHKPHFMIEPQDNILFVGSCFADNMGQRFADNCLQVVKNPYGVMYNPVSILHTVRQWIAEGFTADIAVLTLGTNHVYRLKETGDIVDNCQKRPQYLFYEEELTIDECVDAIQQSIDILHNANPETKIMITVSPIRYAKYGFHGSQLSKSILLVAADRIAKNNGCVYYFPAFEIVNDELRDYRFYAADMLHPSEQTIDYIWERLRDTCFSNATRQMIAEWLPIKHALNHRPFNPESQQYKDFMSKTKLKQEQFYKKYNRSGI